MIKIFYNNKILFLTEKTLNKVTNIAFSEKENIKNVLKKFLEDDEIFTYSIYKASPNKVLEKLKQDFIFIRAAGGIVKDEKNRILFIYRRNKWDLPKGKIDEGENDLQAAIREISEECGINKNSLKIISKLQSTYHIYRQKNDMILKETIWFDIKFSGNDIICPQTEEEITAIKWMSEKNIKTVFDNTYLSIKELLQNYVKRK